jgi:hypothetical protein
MCIGAGGYNPITGTGTSADGFGVLNVSGKLEVTELREIAAVNGCLSGRIGGA